MGGIACKRCQGTDYVKRGMVRNLQRYQCKTCGCNFTNTPPRGKPPAMKALAVMPICGVWAIGATKTL
jgi:transposase